MESGYGGTFVVDGFANFFKAVFYVATALVLLMSGRYLVEEDIVEGEYHALILFALSGMMIMASGRDLLVIYMGLELQALAFYVLAGYLRRDPRLGASERGIIRALHLWRDTGRQGALAPDRIQRHRPTDHRPAVEVNSR